MDEEPEQLRRDLAPFAGPAYQQWYEEWCLHGDAAPLPEPLPTRDRGVLADVRFVPFVLEQRYPFVGRAQEAAWGASSSRRGSRTGGGGPEHSAGADAVSAASAVRPVTPLVPGAGRVVCGPIVLTAVVSQPPTRPGWGRGAPG